MVATVDGIAQGMILIESQDEIAEVVDLGQQTVLGVKLRQSSHVCIELDDNLTVMSKVWTVPQFVEDLSSQPLRRLLASCNASFDQVIIELIVISKAFSIKAESRHLHSSHRHR